MGFAGLIIECHRDPEKALSDARQQLTPSDLAAMLRRLSAAPSSATTDSDAASAELAALRERIDAVDDSIMELLSRRMEIARAIGSLKVSRNMPLLQRARYDSLITSRVNSAEALGLSDAFVRKFLETVHEESLRQQLPK